MTTPAEYEAQIAELKRQNEIFRNAQKACETCDGPTIAEVKTLRSRILDLEAREGKMRKAVEIASEIFRYYEQMHLSKPGMVGLEKAQRNAAHAEQMEAALSLPSSPGLLDRVVKVLEKVEQDHQFPFTVNHDELLAEVQSLLSELTKGAQG